MITFAEDRLNIGVNYGAVGSLSFRVELLEQNDGAEQRLLKSKSELGTWQLGDRSFNPAELIYINEFYNRMRRIASGFRYKDWGDYFAKNQNIGTGDGTKTQFQLIRNYGSYSRKILKPVNGTVIVSVNGILSSPTINNVNGIITFAVAPASGAVVSSSYEFDKPVRFTSEALTCRLQIYIRDTNETLSLLNNLAVKEIRL